MLHRQEQARESGAAAVEFAIVSLLFFYLVFGVLQYGFYFFQLQSGSAAARHGARLASVGIGTDADDCTEFMGQIKDQVGSIGAADVDVTVAFVGPLPVQVGESVTVTVAFPFTKFASPFIPVPGDTISQHATARIEKVGDTSCIAG
jgi:Flp pilus assembly protein TadG